MSHFELTLALDRAVEVANKTVQEGGYLTAEEILAMFIEAGEKVDYVKRPSIAVGNECCGDVSAVKDLCVIFGIGSDNWIEGTTGDFKFQAKVFNEPSTYGIKNGRISKLAIHDINQLHWGFEGCYVNYDRGWDVYPKNDEALALLNSLLEALGDDQMTDEDLIHYTIYVYDTVEDFENMDYSDHIGSFGSMDDSKSELDCEHYDQYARIKIVSSDSEEIEIIENHD